MKPEKIADAVKAFLGVTGEFDYRPWAGIEAAILEVVGLAEDADVPDPVNAPENEGRALQPNCFYQSHSCAGYTAKATVEWSYPKEGTSPDSIAKAEDIADQIAHDSFHLVRDIVNAMRGKSHEHHQAAGSRRQKPVTAPRQGRRPGPPSA